MTSHLISDQESRQRIADLILRLPDQKYEVEITAYKPNRTVLQNKLYWHWLHYLSGETGYSKDELHELAKQSILGSDVKMILGKPVPIPKSTADLNIKDFIDYLTEFEAFFASKGFVLPAPSYYQEAINR